MSDSILVVYATRYGSTQEVAEAVAGTLRERGLEVDLQPMRNVRSLEGYRAVVLAQRRAAFSIPAPGSPHTAAGGDFHAGPNSIG